MPQPLRKPCDLDFSGLGDRPKHAAALGEIVSLSGLLESGVAAILAILTGGNAKVSTAMLLAVNSADAQRAMLRAAAEAVLDDAKLAAFTTTMDRYRTRYTERNRVVHNIWGTSKAHPDKAIWCPAAAMVEVFQALADSDLPGGREQAVQRVHALWSDCFSYTVKDLTNIADRLREFTEELAELSHTLSASHPGISALTTREPGRMLRTRKGPAPPHGGK